MASGANVKIGVDVTQFRQGMQQAQQSAKTLQSQMKANEAQFKATGDKEQYLTEKGKLLKAELEAQKKAAENAEKALEAMKEKGVSETSAEYQKMAQQLAGIQTAMYNTQTAMNNMTVSETKASSGAKDLSTNLNSIAKNVSFEMVIKGIDTITTSMEKAGKKAVEVGKQIWDNITDSAKWADDAATMATMYEVPLERYLQMEALVATGLDTSVEAVLTAQQKLRKGLGNKNESVLDVFDQLHVRLYKIDHSGHKVMRDMDDLFWEAGQAIMGMDDAFDREAAAQAIFGRSWRELIPLFEQFQDKDSFNAALEEQNTVSEESVEKLAELNDKVSELEHNFFVLKTEVLASLAPALSSAADSISQMLVSLTEYLQSDAGQEQLQKLGDAFSQIVEGIMDFDAEAAVKGVVDVLTKITNAFTWISENWETVKIALEAIAGAFLLFKATQGILAVIELINGLKGLGGGSGVVNTVTNAVNQINGVGTGGGGDAATGGIVARIVAKVGGKEAIKAAAVAAAGPVIGTLGGMALLGGIAALAASNNYTYRGIGDAHRFSNVDNPHQLQTAVRGILSANDSNAEWKLGYLTAGIATPEELFGLFDYEDAEKGQQNYLLGIAGKNPQVAAAMYQMYTHRFGGLNTETFNSLPAEWRAALTAGETAYGDIRASGGTLDYTALLSGMRTYFQDYGTFNENGEWTIPVDPEVAEGAAEALQGQIDDMNLTAPVKLTLAGMGSDIGSIAAIMGGMFRGHANGIWSVPWDGYPAILHRGERVVPNRGDSYTSNVYFGSVNLNNGLEVEALTESIDRRNRRMRAGYGS